MYALEHEREKALANLRTALALAPDSAEILQIAVDVCENIGDRKQAISYATKAFQKGLTKEQFADDPELQGLLSDPAIKVLLK